MELRSLAAWFVLCAGLCAWPLSARADAPALHWVRTRGAEGCIDPIALARRVEALTGPVFVAPAAAQLSLAAEISPAGKGFRMRLVLSAIDGRVRGERILQGRDPDCRKLDAAIAFVMALTLDPSLSLADAPAEVLASFAQEVPPEETLLAELAQQPAREPEASAPEVAPEPPKKASPVRPAVRPDVRIMPRDRFWFSAGFNVTGFVLPSFAPGAQVTLGVAASPWLLIAASFKLAVSPGTESLSSDQHATFRALALELAGCPQLVSAGRFLLRACLAASVAQLAADGSDFARNHTARLWAPAAHGSLLAWLRLPRNAGIFTELGARVRIVEQHFAVRNDDGFSKSTVYTPGPVGLQAALGAGYVF